MLKLLQSILTCGLHFTVSLSVWVWLPSGDAITIMECLVCLGPTETALLPDVVSKLTKLCCTSECAPLRCFEAAEPCSTIFSCLC